MGKKKRRSKYVLVAALIIVTMLTVMAVRIWRDDYVPQKLGNSVSAGLNNSQEGAYSIAENEKYIFYSKRLSVDGALFRIDKKTGESKLIKHNIGNYLTSGLFLYNNSIVYTRVKGDYIGSHFKTITVDEDSSAGLNNNKPEVDVYTCDFDGKNEKLIKNDCGVLHMVIDEDLYFSRGKDHLNKVSLKNNKVSEVCFDNFTYFVGINDQNKTLLFATNKSLLEVKINKMKMYYGFSCLTYGIYIGDFKGPAKDTAGVLGMTQSNIWFLGNDGHSLCKVEKKDDEWKTKIVVDKTQRVDFSGNTVMEKNKIYYLSADKTKVIMYDTQTGNRREIYASRRENIKVSAAIGNNLLIEEWDGDSYEDAADDGSLKGTYINNSGKVLYELD